ncbi:MAG: SDR family oxidoreductase [Anaerolineae bacterium]|nr:SDR family oxidoreductase [Anaerolineae bacterium]MDW8072340.1 SDR family NAD(P)-dependent oxidoreductase [Anaerolineae bacterium]
MQLLCDKVALITGAARGIGRAIAEIFAAHGAHIVVTDILEEEAYAVAAAITAAGHPRAIARRLDVSDPQAVQAAIEVAAEEFGRLDILVNNAGVLRPHLILEMPLEDWELTFQVNVRGMFLCSQAAARQMIRQGRGGCIISIASACAKKADRALGAYAASKAAMLALTRVLALELGEYGIRVNAILPGATDTQMLRDVTDAIPGMLDALRAKSVLGRIATPQDQANAALFLASDLAAHITGEGLVVSGGEFMDT